MVGVAGFQAVDDVINMITQNWGKVSSGVNTAGQVPQTEVYWVEKNFDYKQNDFILVKLDDEGMSAFSLGVAINTTRDWRSDVSISLDCRTGVSGKRIAAIVNELVRVLKANVGLSGYMIQLPKAMKPWFEEYRKVYRCIVDITLTKINP